MDVIMFPSSKIHLIKIMQYDIAELRSTQSLPRVYNLPK